MTIIAAGYRDRTDFTDETGEVAPHPLSKIARMMFLADVVDLATEPSRALDAWIATEIFPSLLGFRAAGPGIWIDDDGGRVRALLYSSSLSAATTLVPEQYWIERPAGGASIEVHGPDPNIVGFGENTHMPLAASAAALRARTRLALARHREEGRIHSKIFEVEAR
ncbi:hypothetical protein [Sphingosinicella rhizophila]|uniref:Uncharacterized protein n=1 Tax=Sphingosinicella rhizophila TaxID=3050082 RepID=A0ABU3QD24_9SPHN|nr:hypothetical protein [Sphingosinicella sp. GR2756]MDT9601039.1 hypothetical protein [Sphingosinicella sp. GR2756]